MITNASTKVMKIMSNLLIDLNDNDTTVEQEEQPTPEQST